jgi:hypothetical protein
MPNNLTSKTKLIEARVKKISRGKALLETAEEASEFTLPLQLLPQEIEEGQKLGVKFLDAIQAEDAHDEFARKLLEEIIN